MKVSELFSLARSREITSELCGLLRAAMSPQPSRQALTAAWAGLETAHGGRECSERAPRDE